MTSFMDLIFFELSEASSMGNCSELGDMNLRRLRSQDCIGGIWKFSWGRLSSWFSPLKFSWVRRDITEKAWIWIHHLRCFVGSSRQQLPCFPYQWKPTYFELSFCWWWTWRTFGCNTLSFLPWSSWVCRTFHEGCQTSFLLLLNHNLLNLSLLSPSFFGPFCNVSG